MINLANFERSQLWHPRRFRPSSVSFGEEHTHVDSVAEWSKASDSSSDGAIRVGSNPTAVIFVI